MSCVGLAQVVDGPTFVVNSLCVALIPSMSRFAVNIIYNEQELEKTGFPQL